MGDLTVMIPTEETEEIVDLVASETGVIEMEIGVVEVDLIITEGGVLNL